MHLLKERRFHWKESYKVRGYSFFDSLKNSFNLLYTKIFWKNARLVRLPILARNRENIIISHGFTCGTNCRLNPSSEGIIRIGKDVTLGDQCQIEAMEKVEIGDNVLMASKVYIGDANHGQYDGENQSRPDEAPNKRSVTTKPIRIGNNVWIGNAVTVLGGGGDW